VNGNITTATQTVTVVDVISPTIVAPANLTVSANSACEAVGTFIGTPQINDNCGIASLENDAPSVFPIGTTTVTWIVTDLSGNTSQASHTITVVDETAPVAILNSFNVTLDNDGNASIEFLDVDGGSFDNCGIASVDVFPTEFDCANLGANEVTVTLTDNSGNVTTSKVVVTVNSNGIDSDNDGIDDSCDPEFNEILPIIPEAFTPNGNGINDLFVIGNLSLLGNTALDVFNRHGLLVYSSPNYQNDWDGKRSDNDQALPDGTYYYVLTLSDKTMKGFVYINRVQK
jgi:gliding motility-associated-like protein